MNCLFQAVHRTTACWIVQKDERRNPLPKIIDKDDVQRLITEGAQLVEVLPAAEFEEQHIPGAINIPLKQMDRTTVAQLDRQQPVITYCHDYE